VPLELLAYVALALAALPALMSAHNLRLFRAPPSPAAGICPQVSLLIPARNEEANIGAAVGAALASKDVELEAIVFDDHSTDCTGAIVEEIARQDRRVRLAKAPPLPSGWSGKQHACHVLAARARHDLMIFVDADVRLTPHALARIAVFMDSRDAGLASGFPRQETGTLAEKLIIPLIHFLLLGFLPIACMRSSTLPAFGAGCGQLICVRRAAYVRAGGHSAIRASLHDGVMLPRTFRRAGIRTDLFDATALASCRMYRDAGEVWRGFSKNATEGMATPAGLPVWTALLLGGQVLPFVLLAAGLLLTIPGWAIAASAAALVCVCLNRLMLALRFRQSVIGALLHPLGVACLLVLQWAALINQRRRRPAVWRGRAYSS
jgi:Glycosyl transferase family 2